MVSVEKIRSDAVCPSDFRRIDLLEDEKGFGDLCERCWMGGRIRFSELKGWKNGGDGIGEYLCYGCFEVFLREWRWGRLKESKGVA